MGNKINPWMQNLPSGELYIDNQSINDISYYTVKQDYFWAMGDNRDDSYDSRFWGFVPDYNVLGIPVFSLINIANFKLRMKVVN